MSYADHPVFKDMPYTRAALRRLAAEARKATPEDHGDAIYVCVLHDCSCKGTEHDGEWV